MTTPPNDTKPPPTKRDEPHNCPKCGVSLLDKPIPEKDLEHYGGAKYYKREIGFYSMEYDRTMYYTCPDCKEKIG